MRLQVSACYAAVLLAWASPGAAGEEVDFIPGTFSANVGIFSDYTFRGISQTSEKVALQGGIDYEVDVVEGFGLYTGFWGSNVDFEGASSETVELDFYGGVKGSVAGIDWNLGAIGYVYPGAGDDFEFNYVEVTPGIGYTVNDWLSLAANYYYSPDYFGNSGTGHYVNAGATFTVPLPESLKARGFGLAFDAGFGHQWIQDNATFGTPDYFDWRVGASLSYKMLTLGIAYIDTGIDREDCVGGLDICSPRAVGSLTASF